MGVQKEEALAASWQAAGSTTHAEARPGFCAGGKSNRPGGGSISRSALVSATGRVVRCAGPVRFLLAPSRGISFNESCMSLNESKDERRLLLRPAIWPRNDVLASDAPRPSDAREPNELSK